MPCCEGAVSNEDAEVAVSGVKLAASESKPVTE